MLNEKRMRFVDEFLVDRNAAKAYVRAGYSPNGARQGGSRLLSDVDIQKRVVKAEQKRSSALEWTADDILLDLKEIAENPNNLTRDRLRAYELAGKHLGMFRDVIEHSGHIGQQIDFSAITSDELRLLVGGKREQAH